MRSDQMLSVIMPVTRQVKADSLCRYVETVLEEISRITDIYEIILVTDRGELAYEEAVLSLLEQNAGIRILFLSRARYIDEMIMAGFSSCIGDQVVIFTPPLDPPSLLPHLLERIRKGTIVVGVRKTVASERIHYRLLRPAFYFLTNTMLDLHLPKDTTYLSGYPRHAAAQISQSSDRARFLKVITSQIGWPIEYIEYEFQKGVDPGYRSLRESLRLSVQLICSLTVKPLIWCGIFTGISTLAALAALLARLLIPRVPEYIELITIGTWLASIGISFSLLLLYSSYYLWSMTRSPVLFVRNELCSASMLPQSIKPNIVDKTV